MFSIASSRDSPNWLLGMVRRCSSLHNAVAANRSRCLAALLRWTRHSHSNDHLDSRHTNSVEDEADAVLCQQCHIIAPRAS